MSQRTGIGGVTFDVGGTLIQPWPSVGHVYSRIAERHGYQNIPAADLNRRFSSAWAAKGSFSHSRREWQKIVNETFRGLIPPSDELFDDLYKRFGTRAAWRVFDDVPSVLDQLRARGFKLGIVSNWDERLRPLLADVELSRYFDGFAISVEVGASKPDSKIFQRAAAALGLEPGSLMHVGDTVEEDIKGAREAGFAAVLLDRQAGKARDSEVIETLQALPALLGKPLQSV